MLQRFRATLIHTCSSTMHLRTFLPAFLSCQLCLAASSSSESSPTATLDYGVIVGTTTLLPSSTVTVDKFLGIPFASPPERFAAPIAPAPWNGQLNATEAKPACIQAFICTSVLILQLLYDDLQIRLLCKSTDQSQIRKIFRILSRV
jgi:hypothetical protein